MLVHGKAEHSTKSKESAFVELYGMKHFEEAASPRLLNTHLPVEVMSDDIFKVKKYSLT